MWLARGLALAGRYREAVNEANKAKRYHSDPGFAYRYARLMSLTGETRRSLDWFRYSLRQGMENVAFARKDPDLEKMRADRKDDFAKLTEVKASWVIDWGIINPDEIVLTNTSGFALTDVSFEVRVRSSGYADWAETLLKCDYIPRGGQVHLEDRRQGHYLARPGRGGVGHAPLRREPLGEARPA
jgi:hypothetical protein